MRLVVVALLLVGCGKDNSRVVGSCTYKNVVGKCELFDTDVDSSSEPWTIHAKYRWQGPLPAGADARNAERTYPFTVTKAEAEAYRQKLVEQKTIGCTLELDGGPCPPGMFVHEAEFPK
jgi:hypothetical protein